MKEKILYADDLMLNDLVLMRETAGDENMYPFRPGRVHMRHLKGIDEGYIEAKPIPLTEEILDKNGFQKTNGFGGSIYTIKDGLELIPSGMFSMHSYEFAGTDNSISACTGIYIDYVHELQHILKQCEIDKEIVI